MNGDLLGFGTEAYATVAEDADESHTTDGVDVDALAAKSHVPFRDDPAPPPPSTEAGTIDFLSGSPVKKTGKDTILNAASGGDDNLLGFAQPPPQLQESSSADNLIGFDASGGGQQIGSAAATVDLFEPVAPPPTSSSDPFTPQPANLIQPPVSDPFAPSSDVLQDQPNQILPSSNDYPSNDPFAPVASPSDPFAITETGNAHQEQQQASIHVSAPQSSVAPMETVAQNNISNLIPSPEKALERPAASFSSIGDDVQSMVKNPIPSSTVQYPTQNQSQDTNGKKTCNNLELVDEGQLQHQQQREEHKEQHQTDPVAETTSAITSEDGSVHSESGTHPNPNEIQNESPGEVSESPIVKKVGDSTDKPDEAHKTDAEGINLDECEGPFNTETPPDEQTHRATEESLKTEKSPDLVDDDCKDVQEKSVDNDSESSQPANGSVNHAEQEQQQQPLDSEGSIQEEEKPPPTNSMEAGMLQEQSADQVQQTSQQLDESMKVENRSQEHFVATDMPDATSTTSEQTALDEMKESEVENPEASNDIENSKPQQTQAVDNELEAPKPISAPTLIQNEPDEQEAEKESSEQSPSNNPQSEDKRSEKPDKLVKSVSENETLHEKSDVVGVIADARDEGVLQESSISSWPEKTGDEQNETNGTGNQEESHQKHEQEEEIQSELNKSSRTPDSVSPDAASSSDSLSAEASDDNHHPPTSNSTSQDSSPTPVSHANDKREKIPVESVEALERQLSAAEALIAELQYTEAESKHENDRILFELQSSLQKEMTRRAEAEDAARRAAGKATTLHEEFTVYKKETTFQIESLGEDLATTVKENTAMKNELEQIRAERDEQARNEAALTNRLNSAKKKEGEQAHAAEIFERRTDQLQMELTQTTDKLVLVTAERDCLKKDVANWKQFAEEKTRKIDSALKSERKQNEERKKKMKSFVEAKTEEVRVAKSDHLSLQTELDQTNQSLKDLNQRFKQLHTQWVESQTRCRELQRDITKMKTDSEKMSKVGGTLEAKLSRSAMEAEDHKNKRLAAKNELMALLRQLETEKEVNNRLRDTIKDTFTTKALSQQQTMCDVLDSFEGALQRLALRLNRPVPPSSRTTDSTDGLQRSSRDDDESLASGFEKESDSIGISDTNTTLVLNKLDAETRRVNDYVLSFADDVDRMNVLVDGSHSRGCVDALQKLVGGRSTIASSDEQSARNGLRLPSRGPRYGQVPANAEIT